MKVYRQTGTKGTKPRRGRVEIANRRFRKEMIKQTLYGGDIKIRKEKGIKN